MLQRVQQSRSAVLTQPDGAETVTVTRTDGTTLYEDEAAAAFELSADDTALLDSLSVVWSDDDGTLRRDTVEVAGAFIFELAELAALRDVAQLAEAARTDEKLAAMRALAEQAFEDAASQRLKYQVAYVPRFALAERLLGSGGDVLTSPARPLRAVRSVSEAATPVADLETLDVAGFGVVDEGFYGSARWRSSSRYTIAFEYGYDHPPERIKQAVLTLAKNWLIDGPIDDRAVSAQTETGGTVLFATPGERGSEFGIPEVDKALPLERTRVRSISVGDGLALGMAGSRLDFYGG